jgi:hypothetical protein
MIKDIVLFFSAYKEKCGKYSHQQGKYGYDHYEDDIGGTCCPL